MNWFGIHKKKFFGSINFLYILNSHQFEANALNFFVSILKYFFISFHISTFYYHFVRIFIYFNSFFLLHATALCNKCQQIYKQQKNFLKNFTLLYFVMLFSFDYTYLFHFYVSLRF